MHDSRGLVTQRRGPEGSGPRRRRAGLFAGLGDFGIEALIPIASAAITAGGAVGGAFIASSAQRDIQKGAQKTALLIALDQDRTALAEAAATSGAATFQSGQIADVARQGLSTGALAVGFLGLVWLFSGVR